MRFLFSFIFHTIATAGVFWALQNIILIDSFIITGEKNIYFNLILVSFVFGFLNTFISPFLKIIAIPLKMLTLGIIGFFLSAVMVWLLQQTLLQLDIFNTQIIISGIKDYIIAGIILSITHTIIHFFR